MAYEAQIAGLGDAPPGRPLRGAAIRAMQARSARELALRRAAVVAAVERSPRGRAAPLEFVNGGGTGSLERTAAEPAVTEVDRRLGPVRTDPVRRLPRVHARGRPRCSPCRSCAGPAPASSRRSAVATSRRAPPTPRALPRPHLPTGLRLDRQEGAGEVQTPLLGAAADHLRSAIASTSATPRPVSCASASPACTCSKASGSSRRCRPTAVRDNASCELASQNERSTGASLEGVLREVVETLAAIDRTPCSPGERQAAEWLAARLRAVGGVDVALEDEPSWGTFPPTATGLGLLGMAGAALVLRGRRAAGALLAAGDVRRHRRRGPERTADPAAPRAPAPQHAST